VAALGQSHTRSRATAIFAIGAFLERIRATRVAQGICSLTRLFVREQRKDEKFAPDPLSELTGRERQILELVATGRSNKEIADELFLSEKTVKHYMTNILQVRNRVEAALLAQKSAGLDTSH